MLQGTVNKGDALVGPILEFVQYMFVENKYTDHLVSTLQGSAKRMVVFQPQIAAKPMNGNGFFHEV